MLIKAADDRTSDLEALTQLLARPQVSAQTAERIQSELRMIRAGARTESEAAYDIDFHHRNSKNWAVIHDLRIEYQGRTAQIDHLLMNRFMDFWVCESKSFSQGVAINELGEFTTFYQGRAKGIASPIEQNSRHVAVLEAVLRSSLLDMPSRLGLKLQPKLHSVVLIGPNARITRPQKGFPGIDTVIKSDQLRSTIERAINQASSLSTVLAVAKAISSETLEDLARQVARLHRPISFDWSAKFGVPQEVQPIEASLTPAPRSVAAPGAENAMPALDAAPSLAPDARRDEKVPTSKLGSRWGLRDKAQTEERLAQLGYLRITADGPRLTDKALACGAIFVEKGRYAPYFLWPVNLPR